ncbi:ABC transporter ATP-binding protein [Histidinibacterium aquaticum]|uniref:ABC transporter ATP-binding protein n=1 Tax=Histidinibacterium aquaticum TaxID=2613962 RepID=A0A5J5GK06_9RHOB|nr:ABC transporter ATP-binding protein [Histidinibacterium aquaticum]KAA9007872.1 ABC transporter ATP-binding protein [Histidinibacterium aquaticum]
MLDVRNLSVSYGQHRALHEAALRVDRGEIVVILGANGAGKTTLLKAICGVCEGRVTGEALLEGEDLVGQPPHRIVEAGIALVPEGRGIFPDMTVEENLTLGAYADRARDEQRASLDRVMTLFPKLGERRRQVARTMSGGEQQMVAIGRAMMSNPSILALDEPSLGLSPLLSKDLFKTLRTVREAGLGLLLVEQNARASLAIADRGYLLDTGEITHEAPAQELLTDPAVQRAYLGGAAAKPAPKPAPASPHPAERPVPTMPANRPSPSDIAAQAVKSVASRPARPAAPEPAPAPKPAAANGAAQRPQPAPPRPAPAPAGDRKSASDVLGVEIGDIVGRAAQTSSRRAAPANGSGRLPTVPDRPPMPQRPRAPEIPMPDLGSSADRLKSVLDEIEGAARRAESWRPAPSNPPRR